MPIEAQQTSLSTARHPVASRRILRLALGTSLCLLVTQMIAWPLAFIAPVLTMFLLALPLPAPGLRKGVVLLVAMLAPMLLGSLVLLPFLHHARWAGVLLVALALFYSFYYTARGGSPILGNFMTIGLTVVVTVGSVNADVLLMLIQGLGVCTVIGLTFVWIAHALLPELPPPAGAPAPKSTAEPEAGPEAKSKAGPGPLAARNALRSLAIVMPLALMFLFMSGSPAYTVVMIKVASLGQQASTDESRDMGMELLRSTLWGGLAATIAWYLLGLWFSLPLYALLVAIAALLFGRWIFQGPGLHPRFSMASYALLTMLVLLGPALTSSSGDATAAFWNRMFLILLVAVYGTVAVALFDRFFPPRTRTTDG